MTWRSRSVIDPSEEQYDTVAARDKEFANVAPKLLENRDFRKFMYILMVRTNYFFQGGELTAFEQGKRSFVTQVIGLLCRYGGDAAKAFMREAIDRYCDFTTKHYRKDKESNGPE
jgi:hypothetical protein